MFAFYLFALFASILRIAVCADWCYESQFSCDHKCNEPNQWTEVSASCNGTSQSPINIVTKKVAVNSTLTPLGFQGYQEAFHSIITNNGHTVKLNLSGTAKISGGDLGATYKAVELHFHWGKDGGPGSEHTIDGEQYPMEMHIVHIKEMYSSLQEAVTDPAGVAVLGFLYEEVRSSTKRYDSIIDALANITHPGSSLAVGPLSLDLLIPSQNELKNYFRYKGSLTTPNCSESVIWTVFQNTILLSKSQLSAFSELQFENGMTMVRTFRPVQPLNDRPVYYSSSHVASVSAILVVNTVLITFLTLLE
ncbi:carbonic anhydrase 4b [Colossoma macropomum]|uniref:carbonic anhydrase 4b n=1 Tax=Colossoma macropomum TaxID=42526 RepID=UPI001864107E|nr:carbonic anhydrase 4b [Colossoma macropomum]